MPAREMATGGVQPAPQGRGIVGFAAVVQGIAVEGTEAHRVVGGSDNAQYCPAAAPHGMGAGDGEGVGDGVGKGVAETVAEGLRVREGVPEGVAEPLGVGSAPRAAELKEGRCAQEVMPAAACTVKPLAPFV